MTFSELHNEGPVFRCNKLVDKEEYLTLCACKIGLHSPPLCPYLWKLTVGAVELANRIQILSFKCFVLILPLEYNCEFYSLNILDLIN